MDHLAERRKPGVRSGPSAQITGPDLFDRALGVGALAMLAAVVAAVLRGTADWHAISWQIWGHLATIVPALALLPAVLWRRRGDGRHRLLGYVWVSAMAITALLSFDIRLINRGEFSPIHLLSVLTLITLVRVVLTARSRNIRQHRLSVRLLALGALLIAGFFTFPFGRLLGHWLFS